MPYESRITLWQNALVKQLREQVLLLCTSRFRSESCWGRRQAVHLAGVRDLVVCVLNGQLGMATKPNRGDAVVAGGKPEVSDLRVHLIDVCFPGPENGFFVGSALSRTTAKSPASTQIRP